ncbi:protein kinase family protein [Cellulomonas endometrii]|uniref:protein kinase family protein n=1 Tax=Cellulomonas endometrii TaxID=3036301 RepID=UPI0024AE17E6|nr:protein kinase family protein [Cellulomonas endometrii]
MAQARTGDPGRRDTPGAGRAGTPTGRHGSTVAGRYRLDEPRSGDLPGSERWSATDQILARTVTVTLVSGPRTAAVLDAARRAALVVDPRLARILDVGSADGTGYVVTEAVEGRSLSALAARAPLTADQARAVVGEAAAALEVARRRGVHHLALRPEAVVLTPGSRVVLEGLAVDGELLGAAGGGAHAMSRTDTVGLVRVLYAALTGRWPGVSAGAEPPVVPTFDEWSASSGPAARQPAGDPEVDPGLPAAPEHDGAPLPPADLVAEVPADLDTLCAVTLGPHDDGPHSPGELVRELEPWRAVRADEIFRTADAGRWPAMPAQAGAPAAATAATGTTTAPPTGSSPMSDDQHGSSTAPGGRPADDSTPATGSTGATAAGAAAAGATAAGAPAAGGGGGGPPAPPPRR